jgi:hypothetical protein
VAFRGVQCVGRLAVDAELQNMMVTAGVVWRLVPLVFRYDVTLDAASDAVPTGLENNEQLAANTHAKLACYALGRLGGYFHDDSATPKNERVMSICDALFTPALAKKLGRAKAEQLLTVLNGHEESPTVSVAAVHGCVVSCRVTLTETATVSPFCRCSGPTPCARSCCGSSTTAWRTP